METRFKFRHVNELTGLFVLAVVAVVLAGIAFSGHSQRWFARKYVFAVVLPETGASGLRSGDEVFVLGVSAGRVDDISVTDDGHMTAQVKIRRDFERFVRTDSTATIKKVFGVAGDSFVEITRGTGAPLPEQKPEIVCLEWEDSIGRMEKLLSDLRSEFLPVVKKSGVALDEWTKLGGDLQTNRVQLHQFVARLDHLATGVEEGKGTVGKLLNESNLVEDAQALLAEAKGAMHQLRGMVVNLNGAVTNIQNGTTRLPEITDALANEAKDLPGLIEQTQTSMRELERLIEGVQRHWLVRKYMNKTNPSPLSAAIEIPEPADKTFKPLNSPKGSR